MSKIDTQYCIHCGVPLEERDLISGYDPRSGKARLDFQLFCPNSNCIRFNIMAIPLTDFQRKGEK